MNDNSSPVWLAVSNEFGCSDTSDLLHLFELEAPIVEFTTLGPDTVCEDQVFTSIIGLDRVHNSYLWSTGESTPTISVNTVGTYSVTVSNTNCSHTGEIDIAYEELTNPEILILGDSTFCVGEVSLLYLDQEFVSYNGHLVLSLLLFLLIMQVLIMLT